MLLLIEGECNLFAGPKAFAVKAEPREARLPFLSSAGGALQSDSIGSAVKLEANDATRLV